MSWTPTVIASRLGASFLDVAGSLLDWATAHHGEIREHRARSGSTVPVER